MSKTPESMWAVSSGEYSDYRVDCVCPTKADAEALVAKGFGEGVEELPLLDAKTEQVDVLYLHAEIRDAGTVDEQPPRVKRQWPIDWSGPLHAVTWRWVRAPYFRNLGGRLEVHGHDHEAVRRVYSDRKAQVLAEDAFRMQTEASGGRR